MASKAIPLPLVILFASQQLQRIAGGGSAPLAACATPVLLSQKMQVSPAMASKAIPLPLVILFASQQLHRFAGRHSAPLASCATPVLLSQKMQVSHQRQQSCTRRVFHTRVKR